MQLERTLLQSSAEWLYIGSLTWQQTNWTEPLQGEKNQRRGVKLNFILLRAQRTHEFKDKDFTPFLRFG